MALMTSAGIATLATLLHNLGRFFFAQITVDFLPSPQTQVTSRGFAFAPNPSLRLLTSTVNVSKT